MSQSEQLALSTPTLSVTNFDLPSLHLLHKEIITTLKDTEIHLSEFNDDKEQAPLLLDSIRVLKQLSCIFEFISLKGAQVLSSAIADGLQQLYDNSDNTDTALIMDLSEAIMTFDRYIEFVLLTETVEPTLLLSIVNKLYAHGQQAPISADRFASFGSSSVIIANPEQNFQPLSELNLDSELLTHAYRSGLAVLLTNKDGSLTAPDKQKLDAMGAACAMIAAHNDSLFWQAATALMTEIETMLLLTVRQKHTLIYLEQQFHSYLPVMDSRFADLVGLACKRDNAAAQRLNALYAANQLDTPQREQMQRFLFGPNRAVTDTLNSLVQDQVNMIKDQLDSYSRGEILDPTVNQNSDQKIKIIEDLTKLSSTLRLLSLDTAANSLSAAAVAVAQWQELTPDDFDHLLLALMSAENAIIAMAEVHTPGKVYLPLNNSDISLHQLNGAYEILIKESRAALASAEQDINDYLTESNPLSLQSLPEILYQVAGSVRFLQLRTSASILKQLAAFLLQRIEDGTDIDHKTLAYIADIIVSVDYYLENSQHNQPISKQSLDVGQHSLSQLLAA